MNEWGPIETAPRDRPIILYVPNQGFCQVICEWVSQSDPGNIYADGWWDMYLGCDPYGLRLKGVPTHWKPLDGPPDDRY